jgi:hypothetical protein
MDGDRRPTEEVRIKGRGVLQAEGVYALALGPEGRERPVQLMPRVEAEKQSEAGPLRPHKDTVISLENRGKSLQTHEKMLNITRQ